MSDPLRTDLRVAFEEWCRNYCSPGADASEWYWQVFQGGAEAQRRIEAEKRRERLRDLIPETSRE